MSLVGVLGGLRLGGRLVATAGPRLGGAIGVSADAGMVVTFVLSLAVVAGATTWLGHRFVKHAPDWRLDELAGLLIGLIKGVVLASVIVAFASATSDEHQSARAPTGFGRSVVAIVPDILPETHAFLQKLRRDLSPEEPEPTPVVPWARGSQPAQKEDTMTQRRKEAGAVRQELEKELRETEAGAAARARGKR